MRLNRFLAAAGLGSRRGVEEIITAGRVKINGHVVTDLGTIVGPEDSVKVGNKVVRPQQLIHAILNKPRGYLCTADDEKGRRTIFDLLPRNWPRVSYVGRLDKDSEGLLIVTNDGELSLRLTHPKFKIDKEYEVGVDRPFDPAHRDKLLHGVHIEGGWAKAEHVTICGPKALKLILRQGLKRQIRLMLHELGYEVTHLARTRIGSIRLDIHTGEWRLLTAREIASLRGEDPAAGKQPRPQKPAKPRPERPRRSAAAGGDAERRKVRNEQH
jgi:23S rRNA pseudouridine2605 synthase